MDRLAHRIIAAKGETDVADATGDMAVGQGASNFGSGFNKVYGVVVVLLNAGANGKDIRVENDVFGRKVQLVHQNTIGARANFDFAGFGVGLAHFIERHHHHGSTVGAHFFRRCDKRRFAFFEADRIDDAFTLQAFQAAFDHAPFRRIHHHRQPRNVRLGRNQIAKCRHRQFRVNQALVHIDV